MAKEKCRKWLRSIAAAISAPEKEAAARRSRWATIRGDVWLNYFMTSTGWSWEMLKQELRRNRSRSSLVDKWRQRKASPYRLSAEKLNKHAPGSLALFDLPMWNLLDNRPKSQRDIDRLVSAASESDILPDEIGVPLSMENAYRYTYPASLYGSASLVMEGTISAFNKLIVLTREAEARLDERSHATYVADLYRLFPTIAKISYFEPCTLGIAQAISDLHNRVEWSKATVGVNWEVIRSAIEAPNDEANREELLLSWIRPARSKQEGPIEHGKVVQATSVGNPSLLKAF